MRRVLVGRDAAVGADRGLIDQIPGRVAHAVKDEGLDAGDGIGAVGRAAAVIDDGKGLRARVVRDRVVRAQAGIQCLVAGAVAALQVVIARIARERVVTIAAKQFVVAAVAVEGVGIGKTVEFVIAR